MEGARVPSPAPVTHVTRAAGSHCSAYDHQMRPGVAGFVPVLVQFAAGPAQTQTQAPVSVATRRDVLDSSRLYSYSSALRMDAMVRI